MRLIHYSTRDTLTVEPREQQPHSMKPKGLWVSDEDDFGWAHWCAAEQFRDLSKYHAFAVKLDPAANVLLLGSEGAVREFAAQFDCEDWFFLDWQAVARRYQGVIITPYQWNLRLSDLSWYYPWDCASGCIWDPVAIKSVTPLMEARDV